MLDAILELGNQLNQKLIVPIACTMEYKGFFAMIESNYEFTSQNQVYGKQATDFIQSNVLSDSLMKLGKLLNIKQHPIKGRITGDNTNSDIYLSQNLVIYKAPRQSLEELVVKVNSKVKGDMEKLSMIGSKPR